MQGGVKAIKAVKQYCVLGVGYLLSARHKLFYAIFYTIDLIKNTQDYVFNMNNSHSLL